VYPNPARQQITVDGGDNNLEAVRILDMQGRLVQQVPVQRAETKLMISLQSLQVGPYLVEVRTKQGLSVSRLIKE
jgi:hypothetical protein